MASRRCPLCGVSYPSKAEFAKCPLHDEPTLFRVDREPDDNWETRLAQLKRESDAADGLHRAVPFVLGVEVIEDKGRLFVDQNDLWAAGVQLSRMQPIQFYLFELEDGWVYETQGFDEPRRRWWVEQVTKAEE